VAVLAKTLCTAVAVPGVQVAVDLAALSRSLTMQVTTGGVTPDPNVTVQLQGSLDNVNFFGIGQVVGPKWLSVDEDVIQYARANVTAIASGTVTVLLGYVPG
jgi:hypothetical protein